MLKEYYYLTKPGIIYGNAITTTAGFFLASKGDFDFGLFLATLAGISLVIASGCVFNNYIDREIDAKMERTKNRALVKGTIPGGSAIIFGIILGILGFSILAKYTNLLTVEVALVGIFAYVVLYGIAKRRTVWGTVVGSISGAVPPVVGYCAVSNSLDLGAILLFLILVCWQMPHFYAIAIYRLDDYTRALIPVLPYKKGIGVTKMYMLFYVIAFTVAASLLTFYGYTGYIYLVVALVLSLTWLWFCIKGLRANVDSKLWAKKMFRFSLVVLTILSIMIIIDGIIFT